MTLAQITHQLKVSIVNFPLRRSLTKCLGTWFMYFRDKGEATREASSNAAVLVFLNQVLAMAIAKVARVVTVPSALSLLRKPEVGSELLTKPRPRPDFTVFSK